jgi:iron complex outermembrane receptor protein
MKKNVTLCFLFFIFVCQHVLSQQKPDSLIHLSDLEVKAARNKMFSELGRVVTVIDKSQIERMSVSGIDELLDNVAGVDVRQRGVHGVQSDISVRGGSFDQVLVLLNGINITDPQTGHYNLDIPIDLSDVTRIEVLQGSSARVLGPNAFSGAINIVTEKNDRNQINSQHEAGSFGYIGQTISGNMISGKLKTFASLSHKSSDGYIPNTDFETTNAFAHAVYTTPNAGRFDLQLAAQQKAFGANSFYSLAYPNQFENTKTFMGALNWILNKGKMTYHVQAVWRRHHDRFELFRDFDNAAVWYKTHNYHLTDVAGGRASVAYLSRMGKTTWGVDVRNEHIFSNVLGTEIDSMRAPLEKNGFFTKEDNRMLLNGFLDHSVVFNRWYFSAGVAATNSSAFGLKSYGGVDVAYSFTDNFRIFSSVNSAVRLPTFTDLYYKNATHISNPNLQPEKAVTVEVGAKLQQQNWNIDATVYYRKAKNVIDWVKVPDSTKWESRNLTHVNALGSDLSLTYHFDEGFFDKIALSYSYLNLDKSAGDLDSKYALDYLKHKIVLSVGHNVFKNVSVLWKGGYFDRSGTFTNASNQIVDFKSYFIVDARVLWTQRKFDVFADVKNILNVDYADYGGLEQPGRNYNIGLRVKLF